MRTTDLLFWLDTAAGVSRYYSKVFMNYTIDNGSGIPENINDKIISEGMPTARPFFTTKPAGQGTGLGLSLAYDSLTIEQGGTISVNSNYSPPWGTISVDHFYNPSKDTLTMNSTEGAGSTFIISLPLKAT